MPKKSLFNFEFVSLCIVTFLTLCNVAVFYNFHLYLQSLGIGGKRSGFLIGVYSLTAMCLYGVASKEITLNNAYKSMLIGIFIVVVCGMAYLFATDFWSLVLVRVANGIGIFMIMAGCMVLLVAIIPPDQTGMAFSLYSIAMLLPYSIIPSVSDIIMPFMHSPEHIYLVMAIFLIPAAGVLFAIHRRIGSQQLAQSPSTAKGGRLGGEVNNLFRRPVLAVLMVNGVYFVMFAALFFLFKGLAQQRGMNNPGLFFTMQMGVMILIRLFCGQIFDKYSKVALVTIAFLLTGLGFGLLWLVCDVNWILLIAVVFGLGMGLCVPPLNALMYLVTHPRYRGYNANMMMLMVHCGNFIGPFVGAWIIDVGGYDRFLVSAILVATSTSVFFWIANPARYIHHNGEQ